MSISDMMAGLMLIFLFIAVSFMIEIEAEKETMKDIASSYRDTKADLNEILYSEFEKDLPLWGASISKDNSISFDAPNILFAVNKSDINEKFKVILQDFFPRYIKIINSSEFKDNIKELRVEGHTSNTWNTSSSPQEIYLKNMLLSQLRAYKVLSYCYSLDDATIIQNRLWLEKFFRANGMAYAQLKKEKTRRVTFTIELNSENAVFQILE
ncbi:OmpA family protein [Sulfurimonas sp. SAG-AH-194-I05]|nr:OmpA family protein [Sulfurimonas sp. SAG-AH-194-I05]MDF1875486.1 OmpA family protein [Sulfurimonas sp. SAG-AH-194-I05]